MAEQKKSEEAAQQVETVEQDPLSSLLSVMNLEAPGTFDQIEGPDQITDRPINQIVTDALGQLVSAIAQMGGKVETVDKYLLDGIIAGIDEKIGHQLDEIIHNKQFQQLESTWRGLKFMVDRADFRKGNVVVEVLNVSKDTLQESFEDEAEFINTPLYRKIYAGAYDQYGGFPYGAILGNYEFDSSSNDVALLTDLSKVASASHAPFISSVGPRFFGVDSMDEWKKIPDLNAHMRKLDYMKWNAFRDTEDARYVGLTFPRFTLRRPYGPDQPTKGFEYNETVVGDHETYLWGNAAFAFGSNLIKAFQDDGWAVQIRGPESGGTVNDLPVHIYDAGRGAQYKIPTEVLIDGRLDLECANLGFIPFSNSDGSDFATFFSANSTKKPRESDDPNATANSRINSRLPYIFLASRVAHYLKWQQRQAIGSAKPPAQIQQELNQWISNLVIGMKDPSPAQIAKKPLKEAHVKVEPVPDNPGYYRVETMMVPHFQLEGMDIRLSVVGKIEKE